MSIERCNIIEQKDIDFANQLCDSDDGCNINYCGNAILSKYKIIWSNNECDIIEAEDMQSLKIKLSNKKLLDIIFPLRRNMNIKEIEEI